MFNERTILIIIAILIALTVFFSVSGCALCKRLSNAVFNTSPKPIVDPKTPSGRLWETIKKSTWITPIAIPIIALGAVAMFNGFAKLGMSAIIFGSVNLFMTLASARFALIMAICGLVGSILAVAASILTKNKALKEIICNVQDIKEEAIPELFKPRAKELLSKQTSSTQKIVAKIKAKLI